ncbi:MAG TPA: hypothetical protein VMS31_13270, partial [Pyrinomonadaceae bacterium]|nr:hypothetical protein [Pyrinomonadaceae bacterium]
RFSANFQQALKHFEWCKASYRIPVSCHFPQAPPSEIVSQLFVDWYFDVREHHCVRSIQTHSLGEREHYILLTRYGGKGSK